MFEKWKNRPAAGRTDRERPPLALLVISPSQADRALLRRIFDGTGWEVLAAGDLEEAAAVLGDQHVSIVLCDRELPGVDWRQAVRQLAIGHWQVLLASFVADDYLWDEVIRHGGYDIVSKPFRGDEVLHTVQFAWAALTKSLPSAPRTK